VPARKRDHPTACGQRVRALELGYLDADSRPTTVPAAVRSVVIALTTEPEHPGAGGATATKLVTEVRLRNR